MDAAYVLAAAVPMRVVAALCELPWRDDDFVARVRAAMAGLAVFFDLTLQQDEGAERGALAAAAALDDLFRPVVAERRGGGDDLVGRLWRDGPTLLEDWRFEDTLANVRQLFFNASSTTSFATANALYLLLTAPELREQVLAGEDALTAFVEEALRLHGSAHFRPRLANVDLDLRGAAIGRDQRVAALFGAANRDPVRYPRPDEVDLVRPTPFDHFAFAIGPRFCVGAALARGIIAETVAVFLERLPSARLDPRADPPAYRGFMTRAYRPLHVTFEPAP
jgi:cytochrome P450